ncbi:MAG: UvrD-helicase domain-containing protein [Bacteroidaceae bacterium]|nr:UvrD-helicase domain-containing protein [Bacteroidaceae bacterium]
MSTHYLEDLNEEQRAAVLYTEGPALVIAGAGSGKTRVLTYKIAHLMNEGYAPWNILALTFTNKAAAEMKNRISRFVGDGARGLWMGTFHSIFSRILRMEAESMGFTHNFTIYDASDSKSLLKSIIKEMQLDDKTYKPGTVQSHISNAKNRLMLPSAYASDPQVRKADDAARMPAISDIYRRYWERCRQADAMDFDDLLVYTWLLFDQHPEVRAKYADQFRYVLVDEYQDTNFAQHAIVWQLTAEHQHVCVVGDDAQSIYSFRGANIDNILKFTQQYTGARLFKLQQNYRSTQTIVKAANSLIAKNSEQIRKEVFSEKDEGEAIRVYCAYSDVEEGEIVANKITELHRRKDIPYSQQAILYRTNAQSRIFEEALRKRSIPCRIYGGISFYQRKEIKDIIAYFRLAVNPNDEEALKRVINYPARGIGNTTVNKIVEAATGAGVSLWQVLSTPLEYGLTINKGTHAKLQGFRELIEGFMSEASVRKAYDLGQDIIRQSGIMNDIMQDRTPEGLSRQENLEEFASSIHDFCATREEEGNEHILLSDFLSEVSLLSEMDMDKGDSENEDKLTLMTIHSAKGLEFRVVYVVGMEENLFPSPMAQESYRQMEEERRLFYVALTRAEEHCFLSFARSRFRYGKTEFSNPSRFLKDIDPHYLNMPDAGVPTRREPSEKTRSERLPFSSWRNPDCDNYQTSSPYEQRMATSRQSSFRDDELADRGYSSTSGYRHYEERTPFRQQATPPPVRPTIPQGMKRVVPTPTSQRPASATQPLPSGGLQAGQVIEHERFGIGDVLRVEGTGDNMKATIRFRNVGEKQLLLRFARFKVVG